jgi:hypothetical protein
MIDRRCMATEAVKRARTSPCLFCLHLAAIRIALPHGIQSRLALSKDHPIVCPKESWTISS